MSDWNAVSYFSARQVVALMDVDEGDHPPEDVTASAHYDDLRARAEDVVAVDFLAHALPRFEGIAWAARILDDESRKQALPVRDRLALDTALRWLGEPVEANRLAALQASETAGKRSAERLLALAVYFSGGTISEPDLPPINPPPEASGRFAGGAIKAAAYRTDDPKAIISAALTIGEAIAERGIAALSPT